ncbi:MAG: methionyl-tRNA formyltransferase [Burkholderiales bacterium]|nr:methionyl-tRNA formyltransferase [Burkholderiales bacterium]
MNPDLQIVFAGTPEISSVVLKNLLEYFQVTSVITQPDRPCGRGKKIQVSKVKELAIQHKIEVLQPQSLQNNNEILDKINTIKPDFIIVVAYGLIIPKKLLELPKYGCINIHVSLLPQLRGAAPIQRAIINGESITGVTIMRMDEGLDTGDILLSQAIPIDECDTSGSLHNKLAQLGSQLIIKYLNNFQSIAAQKQPDTNVSYAEKIEKHEALINWHENATIIWRKIRGFNPAPGSFSFLSQQLIKIWSARVAKLTHTNIAGTIIKFNENSLQVACGDNTVLDITELQPSGKNKQTAKQFYLGHHKVIGMIFSTNPCHYENPQGSW